MDSQAEQVLASAPNGRRVMVARESGFEREWAELPVKTRAKLVARFRLVCSQEGVSHLKFRKIKGCEHIWEVKLDNPLIRLYMFLDRSDWCVTHMAKKPKDNAVLDQAKRALRIRERHFGRPSE